MNYLFDISPTEVPDQKRKPAKKRAEKPAETAVLVVAQPRKRGSEIIGRSVDHYTCADESCQSAQFDILDDWKGEWFVECMICGVGQYVASVPGVLKTPDEAGEFVFADGIYEGRKMSDVAGESQGCVYIKWAAKSHKREAVRIACKKWIDSLGGAA